MTIIAVQKTTTGILMGADNRTSDGVRCYLKTGGHHKDCPNQSPKAAA